MVRLQTVKLANLDLVKSQSLVAVFAGGTSGIGEYTLRALANVHADIGKGLRVYLIGRNESAGQKIIADCQDVCPNGRFTFVKANDLSLLNEVDELCAKVIALEQQEEEPRIDFLVMSQACPPWWPHKENAEGFDYFMSLLYYSRMRMIVKFLPLLTTSKLPAHVVSVYAAGCEGKLLTDDLSLRKPGNCTLIQVRSHVTYMTTLFMEYLSAQYPGQLSLIHIFPSLVVTPAFWDPSMPTVFRLLWKWVGQYVAPLIAVPAEESGSRILYLATSRFAANGAGETVATGDDKTATGTDGKHASGVYAVNWNGETIPVEKSYRKHNKKELSKLVLDHTRQAFEQIEKGQKFEG